MAFSETTKPTIDGSGVSFNQVVVDKSAGSGPYLPAHVRARFDGALVKSEWSHAAQSGGIVNTTTAETLAVAPSGSLRNYLTRLDVSADALGAATELVVRDGAGGTVLWRLRLGDAGLDLKPVVFDPPLKASAATLLEVAMLAAVTGAVYVNASGFIAD